MKHRILKTMLFFTVAACLGLSSCEESEDGLITAITVKEAVYVSPIMQLSLKDNATLQLTPFFMPQNAKNTTVVYSNKHPELMTVSETGLITAKAVGTDTVTIRATDGSNVSVSYPVFISDHLVKATAINVTAAGANMKIKIDKTFDLGACVSLDPADTWEKTVTYTSADETIASVTPEGIVSALAEGETTIRIATTDGSNITRDVNVTVQGIVIKDVTYARTGWTATAGPEIALSPDATIGGNNAMYLLDNGSIEGKTAESCLSLYKPGREGTPMASFPDEVDYFVIDMKAAQDIDYFILRHRSDNLTVALQVWKASFYGSNDGVNFTLIKGGVTTRAALNDEPPYSNLPKDDPRLNVTIRLDATVNYRYIKMTYDDWNHEASGSMQVAEFNVGKVVIE